MNKNVTPVNRKETRKYKHRRNAQDTKNPITGNYHDQYGLSN